MKNRYRLFSEVTPFYQDLLDAIAQAEETISMMYLIYDYGCWTEKIYDVLVAKRESGVRVRIMVDLLGTITDHPTNIFYNFRMLKRLEKAGIEINIFQPSGSRMSFSDRLHIKLLVIDQSTLFIGGSNMGDYYTNWQDTNLRIDGDFGLSGHDLFEFVAANSLKGKEQYQKKRSEINLSDFWFGDAQVLLTVPGSRKDIRNGMLDLVLSTNDTIYFRHWYFLPNKEFLNAMLSQLERGVNIRVLLSHNTRIPIIDIANHIPIKKLVLAGAQISRYHTRYMHSKITWNKSGDIIFGSANIEGKGLNSNFELCLRINNQTLSNELTQRFSRDCAISLNQTPTVLKNQLLLKSILAYMLCLASPLLQ